MNKGMKTTNQHPPPPQKNPSDTLSRIWDYEHQVSIAFHVSVVTATGQMQEAFKVCQA